MRSFKVMFFWSFDGIFIGFQGDFIGLIFFWAGWPMAIEQLNFLILRWPGGVAKFKHTHIYIGLFQHHIYIHNSKIIYAYIIWCICDIFTDQFRFNFGRSHALALRGTSWAWRKTLTASWGAGKMRKSSKICGYTVKLVVNNGELHG